MRKFKGILLTGVALLGILFAGVAVQQSVSAAEKATVHTAKSTKPMHHYLLVMGHGAGDPGARGNGTTEAHFMRAKLMPKLQKYAKEVKHSKISFYNPKHNIVRDTLVFHKGSYRINKKTTVIMFHLDASTSRYAHGGHVIIHRPVPTKRDRRLAHVIKTYVGLNSSYHGYSYRTNLRNCNVLRRRGIDYSLLETGFITNKHDFRQINHHLDQIAKGYIEAITNEKIK